MNNNAFSPLLFPPLSARQETERRNAGEGAEMRRKAAVRPTSGWDFQNKTHANATSL